MSSACDQPPSVEPASAASGVETNTVDSVGLDTPPPSGSGGSTSDPVSLIVTPVSLDYHYAASPEESSFFRGLAEGRILGQRCPKCRKVYVPPRGACPTDGVPTAEEIELSHVGTVTTFCVVNVPFLGQKIKPPYVSAYVLLDGADIALQHLILDIPAEEVRMGMRVEAVWKPRDEWGTSIENISHFAPTGEPDADFDSYKHHL
ncbi:MAG TPA: Zn-ribbon domain-containing OB-fold protein [Nocardioides sp.]